MASKEQEIKNIIKSKSQNRVFYEDEPKPSSYQPKPIAKEEIKREVEV
jgi:hypothetical protein